MFEQLKKKFINFTTSIKKKINNNIPEENISKHNDDNNNKKITNNLDFDSDKKNKNINILNKMKSFIIDREIIISKKDIEKQLESLKYELISSDIAFNVCEEIITNIENKLVNSHIKINTNIEDLIKLSIMNTISEIISKNEFDFDKYLNDNKNTFIHILLIGINGTGKTTSLAKLINYIKEKHNKSIVVAAGDTYRSGAIEQLEIHCNRLNTKLIKYENRADPTSVIYEGIQYCKKNNIDILLSDTAGRMHTNKNLMGQLEKIYRVTKPDLVLFVEDATSGNDTIERINYFSKIVPIDGIILTKIDADIRGGAAISISYISKKPILFVGTGQEYSDFIKFNSDWFINEIFKNNKN